MTSPLNADLHCHSVVSDGTLSPQALAQRAKSNGVTLWALTDHDEVGGQAAARAAALSLGLDYLTGVEISVTFLTQTVHIVGLGFDADNRQPVSYTHLDVYKRQPGGLAGFAASAGGVVNSALSATCVDSRMNLFS